MAGTQNTKIYRIGFTPDCTVLECIYSEGVGTFPDCLLSGTWKITREGAEDSAFYNFPNTLVVKEEYLSENGSYSELADLLTDSGGCEDIDTDFGNLYFLSFENDPLPATILSGSPIENALSPIFRIEGDSRLYCMESIDPDAPEEAWLPVLCKDYDLKGLMFEEIGTFEVP